MLLEEHNALWLEMRHLHIAEATAKIHDKAGSSRCTLSFALPLASLLFSGAATLRSLNLSPAPADPTRLLPLR